MNCEIFDKLYQTVMSRKENPAEGSYTCYLFDSGLDKILKKVGEESAETIIAAKNGDRELLCGELCDLIYHLTVLVAQTGLTPEEIIGELEHRNEKIGNLKQMKKTDRNT